MKTLILLFAAALSALAQITPAQTTPPATSTISSYPSYFVGLGASYNHYATPPMAAGWITGAVQIKQGMYSITTLDMTSTTSSLRTGLAQILTQTGNFTLLAHVDGGLTTTSTVSLGSFSGGGILMYDLGGVSKRLKGVKAMAIVRVLAVSATAVQGVWEFGFGRAF